MTCKSKNTEICIVFDLQVGNYWYIWTLRYNGDRKTDREVLHEYTDQSTVIFGTTDSK